MKERPKSRIAHRRERESRNFKGLSTSLSTNTSGKCDYVIETNMGHLPEQKPTDNERDTDFQPNSSHGRAYCLYSRTFKFILSSGGETPTINQSAALIWLHMLAPTMTCLEDFFSFGFYRVSSLGILHSARNGSRFGLEQRLEARGLDPRVVGVFREVVKIRGALIRNLCKVHCKPYRNGAIQEINLRQGLRKLTIGRAMVVDASGHDRKNTITKRCGTVNQP